jgi:hypothetical protein
MVPALCKGNARCPLLNFPVNQPIVEVEECARTPVHTGRERLAHHGDPSSPVESCRNFDIGAGSTLAQRPSTVPLFTTLRLRRHCVSWAASLALLTLLAPASVFAQSAASPEVKAAFLLNFAKFVTWPASQLPEGRPIVIGVIGNSAVADSLTALTAGKTIDGHTVVVTRIGAGDDPARAHVLFIGDAERGRIPDVLKRVHSSSVLTVSDAARFCLSGGIIQLRNEDDRIRFDINLERAQAADLSVNSKLLALAGTVNPAKN